MADGMVVSTSAYTTPIPADDWLVTPPITLPPGAVLEWVAVAADYPGFGHDGYEVRIATAPVVGAFRATPPLFSVPAESVVPVAREVSLAPWAGQTVFIAFRNHTLGGFVLGLDRVTVR